MRIEYGKSTRRCVTCGMVMVVPIPWSVTAAESRQLAYLAEPRHLAPNVHVIRTVFS